MVHPLSCPFLDFYLPSYILFIKMHCDKLVVDLYHLDDHDLLILQFARWYKHKFYVINLRAENEDDINK